MASRVARVAACKAFGDDDDGWPEPRQFLFLVFSLGAGRDAPQDSNEFRAARGAGAVVASQALLLAAVICTVLTATVAPTFVAKRSWLFTAAMSVPALFLGPSVTEVAVTLLLHGPPGAAFALTRYAIAAGLGLGGCAAFVAALSRYAAAQSPDDYTNSDTNSAERLPGDARAAALRAVALPFWQTDAAWLLPPTPAGASAAGSRDTNAAGGVEVDSSPMATSDLPHANATVALPRYRRYFVVEDVATAHAVAALLGVHPSDHTACGVVAASLLAVTAAHAAFLLRYRPYPSRLEQRIAVALASLQVAIGAATVTAVVAPSDTTADAVGVLLAAFDVATLLALLVTAAAAVKEAMAVAPATAADEPTEVLGAPLLAMPEEAADASPGAQVSNPLSQ